MWGQNLVFQWWFNSLVFWWLILQLITYYSPLCSSNNGHGVHHVCTVHPLRNLQNEHGVRWSCVPELQCLVPASSHQTAVIWCLNPVTSFDRFVMLITRQRKRINKVVSLSHTEYFVYRLWLWLWLGGSLADWLRWFPSFALRIPTAHDFCVISARKWARAHKT